LCLNQMASAKPHIALDGTEDNEREMADRKWSKSRDERGRRPTKSEARWGPEEKSKAEEEKQRNQGVKEAQRKEKSQGRYEA